MSFTKKRLSLTIDKTDGSTFQGTSSQRVTITGLRILATIIKAGPPAMGHTQIRVFGLAPSLMNQLSTFGSPVFNASPIQVTLMAGDDVSGMAIAGQGTLQSGWADYDQAPEVAFNMELYEGYYLGLKVIPPTTIQGTADCAQIMQQLAKAGALKFENNGVNVKLSNPYFAGDVKTQIMACAEAGNFNWYIEDSTLAIWPLRGSRAAQPTVSVSPTTGMVGYPKFMQGGVIVRMLFNPTLRYGAKIQVQSSLQPACGTWGVVQMVSELASETPDGDWFTTVQALKPDYVESVNATSINIPSNL